MDILLNGNGSAHGTKSQVRQPAKGTARTKVESSQRSIKENKVTFTTAGGLELRGTPIRTTRHLAVFELYDPIDTPRVSEALEELEIIFQARVIYSGRAVVRSIVDLGTNVVCEATLNESFWKDLDPNAVRQFNGDLTREFRKFLGEWQKIHKVLPEFKEAVSEIRMFLTDLRLWLEQIELEIHSSPAIHRPQLERAVIEQLAPQIIPVVNTLFGKFEKVAADLTEDSRPAHRNYIQRSLHQIVLCAPFANRTYKKPLGYPGDYEMVNMMSRDPQEGTSLFSKIFNVWLLEQGSAVAHRNRLRELSAHIESEAMRVSRSGKKARIYNFACGPAIEVQHFLENSLLGEQVEFTLADFNSETLEHTKQVIHNIKDRLGRRTIVRFQKKAVHQLFKDNHNIPPSRDGRIREYDFIYCAGLFDYLTDQVCKQLLKIFHGWLAPGGQLLVTNVTPLTPNQGSLDLILDWHLIYRNAAEFEQLCSGIIPNETIRVRSDHTGVNIFMEVRKPNDH
ncbi:MAG TPA: class I SAM-dependent methyltransferase [Pseudomonadales bacterium]|nr:class I SAM-dependent methyltransferase [Pseudomonadales bacterium]